MHTDIRCICESINAMISLPPHYSPWYHATFTPAKESAKGRSQVLRTKFLMYTQEFLERSSGSSEQAVTHAAHA